MIPVNINFPERIGSALSDTFPELGPIPTVSILKDGFRNVVVETPGGQVFKIARSWEASATLAKEVEHLPTLAAHVPVPIPCPRWYAGRSAPLPFGALGYPRLSGRPLVPDMLTSGRQKRLSLDVGTFLAALHGISADVLNARNLPRPDTRWYELGKTRDTILPLLRDELSASEYAAVDRWWKSFLSDERTRSCTPVLQHGDAEHENILVPDGDGRVSGVVDFETLAIDDPAIDIAAQLHLGRDFALAVLDHYQAAGGILGEDFEYRVQRHWELRGFNGMRLAIQHENQREFDWSLARLRQGPLLNEATRRETAIWPPPQR